MRISEFVWKWLKIAQSPNIPPTSLGPRLSRIVLLLDGASCDMGVLLRYFLINAIDPPNPREDSLLHDQIRGHRLNTRQMASDLYEIEQPREAVLAVLGLLETLDGDVATARSFLEHAGKPPAKQLSQSNAQYREALDQLEETFEDLYRTWYPRKRT